MHVDPASPTTPARRPFTLRDQFFVSCLWLAYNLQWGALLPIVLPYQIEAMAGAGQKELVNGLVGPAGALVALVVTPIAGALSDRCRSPHGRRRPYLVAGVLLNVIFLLLMSQFGPGSNILLFALCYMGLQFGCNWWGGPYAGLIPDVVPSHLIGRASGFQALMTALGTLVGALAAGQLVQGNQYWRVYVMMVGALVVLLGLTLWGVKEQPLKSEPEPFAWGRFFRSFYIDPRAHRNFYWVLATRGMVAMGVYSVFTFFQYFLADVVRVQNPAEQASLLIGVIIAGGIPTSILAGVLSDRHGRKPLVYLSGGIMAVASAIYIAVAFSPSLGLTFLVAGIFGIGNGAYQAVDWALAVDVLPEGDSAAKDMGIWHIALVLPQVFAPAITGLTLNQLKPVSLLTGYVVVFVMTTVWFVLGTAFVRQVRGVR